MNKSTKIPVLKPEILFLSLFGVGFIPFASGTWGTLVTLPFFYLAGLLNPPTIFLLPLLIIATVGSSYIAEIVQKKYEVHDPSWIVIDEAIGMGFAWLFISEFSLLHLAVLFVLFRFFDIIKVWPASYFDKKVDHGAGTIVDDVISGIYAGLVYKLLIILGLL